MKLNIIIIGAGMYVCGKGTNDFGTILPALFEWKRLGNPLGNVNICSTSLESSLEVEKRAAILSQKFDINIQLRVTPKGDNRDDEAYLELFKQISPPACVIISVPDHLHRKIAKKSIEAGYHTLIVKPFVTNVRDAKELIAIQKKYNIYGAVEFHKRFDRSNLKLKEIVKEGKIGDLLYFIVEYSQRKTIPTDFFSKWIENTNIFQYLGVHYVDIIYFSTRAIPVRVTAIGQYGWLKDKNINTFDAINAIIEWKAKNGKSFFSHLFTNWIDPESTSAMSDQKIKVIGTRGRFESDQKNRGIKIITDEFGIEEPNPDFCSTYISASGKMSYQGYGIESIHTFLKDVICLHNNSCNINDLEKKRPTFTDSIPSTSVIEAVNKSLDNNGKWENIFY